MTASRCGSSSRGSTPTPQGRCTAEPSSVCSVLQGDARRLLAETNRDPKSFQPPDRRLHRAPQVGGGRRHHPRHDRVPEALLRDEHGGARGKLGQGVKARPEGAKDRGRQGAYHGGDKADGAGGGHPHPVRHPDVRQLRNPGRRL